MAVEDTIVVVSNAVVALDASTGEERWTLPAIERSPRPTVIPTCEGQVVVFMGGSARGLLASSGEEVFRTDARVTMDSAHAHGCVVTYLDPVSPGEWELRALDARSGNVRTLRRSSDTPHSWDPTPEHLIYASADGPRLLHLESGSEEALPEGTNYVVGSGADMRALRSVDGGWEAIRVDGSVRWHRASSFDEGETVVARIEDDLVLLGARGLERIDGHSGVGRWTMPMSAELVALLRWGPSSVLGDRMVLASADGPPDVLLMLDLATGTPLALRLLAEPAGVALAGDVIAVRQRAGLEVFHRDLEGASPRESRSFDDDFAASLALLERSDTPSPRSREPADYPSTSEDARDWLSRVAPIAGDRLSERVLSGTLEASVALLDVLAAVESEAARDTAVEVLRRSIALAPDSVHCRVRSAAAASLGRRLLPPALAGALAENAIAWWELARGAGWPALDPEACGRPADECALAHDTLGAIVATARVLEANATDPAPMVALHQAITAGSPAASCAPTGEDAARWAAIRHVAESARTIHAHVVAPGFPCSAVATTRGEQAVIDGPEGSWPDDSFVVGLPEPRLADRRGDAAWDLAPTRSVRVTWYLGFHVIPRVWVVQQVGGVWRVVSEESR